jgi:hypothetical protein
MSERRPHRIRGPGGDSDALLQAAAHLYQLRGRFDMALAILLRLKRADVFAFLDQHALFPLLRGKHVAQLIRIDEARATSLLVDRHQEVPASAVVPALQVVVSPRFRVPFSFCLAGFPEGSSALVFRGGDCLGDGG